MWNGENEGAAVLHQVRGELDGDRKLRRILWQPGHRSVNRLEICLASTEPAGLADGQAGAMWDMAGGRNDSWGFGSSSWMTLAYRSRGHSFNLYIDIYL